MRSNVGRVRRNYDVFDVQPRYLGKSGYPVERCTWSHLEQRWREIKSAIIMAQVCLHPLAATLRFRPASH